MKQESDTKVGVDKSYAFFKQARNRLRKHNPDSILSHAIDILQKVARRGVEVMCQYQPWNVLLLIKWSLEEADAVSHRRPPATLNDLHRVLNILHDLEGTGPMPEHSQHVYLFMRRIAFQEFWLQYRMDGDALARQELFFCNLPREHTFQRDFKSLTGVTCADFTELAFALMSLFETDNKRQIVRRENFSNLDPAFISRSLDSFLSVLSRDIPSLHASLTSSTDRRRSIADQIYLPSPLIAFPLWKRGPDYIPYSPTLLMRSLERFIYRTLKSNAKEEFSSKFGAIFERHVRECLVDANVNFADENSLKKSLADSGKCVDFIVVEDECNILIDAKGVEASELGRVSRDAAIVYQTIKSSAKSGIQQGQDTARRIAATRSQHAARFGTKQNYLLVVTFDALYLGSSYEFSSMFGNQVVAAFQEKFGNPLPIPFENIFFLTIAEFEQLLGLVRSKTTTFVGALLYVQNKDSNSATRKFSFHQHLDDLSSGVRRLPRIQHALEGLCDRCESHFYKRPIKPSP